MKKLLILLLSLIILPTIVYANGTKTDTEINYYQNEPKTLYTGNKVKIYMEQKTLKAVLVDKIFY